MPPMGDPSPFVNLLIFPISAASTAYRWIYNWTSSRLLGSAAGLISGILAIPLWVVFITPAVCLGALTGLGYLFLTGFGLALFYWIEGGTWIVQFFV